MNNSTNPYSESQLHEILNNFEFYNSESNCFYRSHGNVLQRYSQYLSDWILELDKNSINSSRSIYRNSLTIEKLSEYLLHNKNPRNTQQVNSILQKYKW